MRSELNFEPAPKSTRGAAALAEQLEWLQRELAQIKGDHRCIVAAWHHPLFSTGLHHGDGEAMRPVWEALSAAGADIVSVVTDITLNASPEPRTRLWVPQTRA